MRSDVRARSTSRQPRSRAASVISLRKTRALTRAIMALRPMSNDMWRWADPNGQQRTVRLDELRAPISSGLIAPNTPGWEEGWAQWQPAHDVPELSTSAVSAANGVVPNIPPPPLAVVAVQHEFEAKAAQSFHPPPPAAKGQEPPPPPNYVPVPTRASSPPMAA